MMAFSILRRALLILAIGCGGIGCFGNSSLVNPSPLSNLDSKLTYPEMKVSYTINKSIKDNKPIFSDKAATAGTPSSMIFSISPTLPAGLLFDNKTGVISGIPQFVSSPQHYTVTVSPASHLSKVSPAVLSIAIIDHPPSDLTYLSIESNYTKGALIKENQPFNSGGAVDSYSVSPDLPVGLFFNSKTGTISGNPAVLSESKSYTVTAANSGGSTSQLISIAIVDVAPNLSYPFQSLIYKKGLAISNVIPLSMGGIVLSYSISPALPSGLFFDTKTGIISGIPMSTSVPQTYFVFGANSGGMASAVFSIEIVKPPAQLNLSGPNALQPGYCSPSFLLRVLNSESAPATLTSEISVNLSVGSKGVSFYKDPSCSTSPVSNLAIVPGQNSIPFYLKAQLGESINLKADSSGLTSASHDVQVSALQNRMDLFAGNYSNMGSMQGAFNNTKLKYPTGVARVGNFLYVSDFNHTIIKMDLVTGLSTMFAGTPLVKGMTNGYGSLALFNNPEEITTDGTNLYIVDAGNHVIRKIIIETGVVSILAGNPGVVGSQDGIGQLAQFQYPLGITINGTFLFVSDPGNHTIRKIEIATGAVTTLAGKAYSPGSTDGVGVDAQFNHPGGIVIDGTYLYIADNYNSTIRKLDLATGFVSTWAGAAGINGHLDGLGQNARFKNPWDMVKEGGNLYVTEYGNCTVRKIAIATAKVTTFVGNPSSCGSSDGTGMSAQFKYPDGIMSDGGHLYVADFGNHVIRKLNLQSAEVTTLTGVLGVKGFSDGIGAEARFDFITGLAYHSHTLYGADFNNHTIRKVDLATGNVFTIAGTPGASGFSNGIGQNALFKSPRHIATDGINLYISDSGNQVIRKIILATGEVSTIAGTPGVQGSADGVGPEAQFHYPTGLASDGTYLYVASFSNHTIRKINIETGEVTTIAGSPGVLGSTNGIGTDAKFFGPSGVTTDGVNLYISDYSNHTIRKLVIATTEVTTLAGAPGIIGKDDGIGANAKFQFPWDLTTDGTHLYVSDSGNHTVRKVSISTGLVSTLAGKPTAPYGDLDGLLFNEAQLSGSFGIVWTPSGIFLGNDSNIRWIH